jgi:mono/diheme cytochrome c family protein
MLGKRIGIVIGAMSVVAFTVSVNAQQAAAPANPAATNAPLPQIHPRPGFQLPPENSSGLYPVNGEPFFRANCGACHEPAINGAESRTAMAKYTPEQVYDKLMNGSMYQYGVNMNQAQI